MIEGFEQLLCLPSLKWAWARPSKACLIIKEYLMRGLIKARQKLPEESGADGNEVRHGRPNIGPTFATKQGQALSAQTFFEVKERFQVGCQETFIPRRAKLRWGSLLATSKCRALHLTTTAARDGWTIEHSVHGSHLQASLKFPANTASKIAARSDRAFLKDALMGVLLSLDDTQVRDRPGRGNSGPGMNKPCAE